MPGRAGSNGCADSGLVTRRRAADCRGVSAPSSDSSTLPSVDERLGGDRCIVNGKESDWKMDSPNGADVESVCCGGERELRARDRRVGVVGWGSGGGLCGWRSNVDWRRSLAGGCLGSERGEEGEAEMAMAK